MEDQCLWGSSSFKRRETSAKDSQGKNDGMFVRVSTEHLEGIIPGPIRGRWADGSPS